MSKPDSFGYESISLYISVLCTYMIKINEPQLPWLQTAIYISHTGLDVKMEVTQCAAMYVCTCRYDAERKAFEEERSSWQEELGMARQEVLEQNDRLTLLSQQLAGTKASFSGTHHMRMSLDNH